MRTRSLVGVIAVVLLILAVWLVPMALAAAGSTSPDESAVQSLPSDGQCPFLQAHPWLDPHGAGSGAGASTGASLEVMYY